jgi:glycosyltransferase involved in cell wall biosynthesis
MLPAVDEPPNLRREPYIAFVGTINNARRVDEIFEAAMRVYMEYPQICFRVLTRQNVESKLPNVEIIRKKTITDNEISDFLRNAYAVFLTHSVAAQSGNIPVAYRVGTPVIGFTVDGISQHIINKQTGYCIRQEQFESDLVTAIGYITGHLEEMIIACRSYFDTYFSGELAGIRYEWVANDNPSAAI